MRKKRVIKGQRQFKLWVFFNDKWEKKYIIAPDNSYAKTGQCQNGF